MTNCHQTSILISELPHSQPQITGGGDLKNVNYKSGDLLNLTCTSAPSNPPAKLEWILNDEPVSFTCQFKERKYFSYAHCSPEIFKM